MHDLPDGTHWPRCGSQPLPTQCRSHKHRSRAGRPFSRRGSGDVLARDGVLVGREGASITSRLSRAPAREAIWPADQVERWPIDVCEKFPNSFLSSDRAGCGKHEGVGLDEPGARRRRMRGNCGTRAHPRSAATRHYRGPGDGCAGLDRRAEARLCDRRQPAWGTPPASEVEGLVVSFAGTGISARDHSVRMAKKPVMFSTICRASSRLRSRPRRGFQISRVRSP